MTYSPTNAKIWNRKLRQVGRTIHCLNMLVYKSFLNQFTTNSAVIKNVVCKPNKKLFENINYDLGLFSQNNYILVLFLTNFFPTVATMMTLFIRSFVKYTCKTKTMGFVFFFFFSDFI